MILLYVDVRSNSYAPFFLTSLLLLLLLHICFGFIKYGSDCLTSNYESILPTFLTYIVLSTKGYYPLKRCCVYDYGQEQILLFHLVFMDRLKRAEIVTNYVIVYHRL